MKMKVSICCLMSLQCLLPQTDLNAGTMTFPRSAGDIASCADWGRTEAEGIPGPSDTVLFNQGGGSYTASADVSFASLLFSQWSTFAMPTEGRVVQISGGVNPEASNVGLTIKSGLWDFRGTGKMSCVKEWSTKCGCRITLSDGAVATNVARLTVGRWSSSTLTLTGAGTALHSNDYFADDGHPGLGFYNDVPSKLNVLGGARLVCGNFGWSGGEALVSGSGSEIYCPSGSGVTVGKKCNNVVIHVTDGGSYRNGAELLFPADGTRGALIDVDNCATGSLGTVYFGNYAGTSGNGTIRVGRGGLLEFGTLRLYGTSNRLVVSNGAFKCSTLYYGGAGKATRDCEFYVTGSEASLDITTFASGAFFSSAGTGNAYTFDGCSTNTLGVEYFSSGASSNRLNVVNGSKLRLGNFLVKNYDAGKAIDDNAILVANGAELWAATIAVSGLRNEIAVSNATLVVMGNEGLSLGSSAQSGAQIADNRLVVAGTAPQVSAKNLYLNNSSKVIWSVPTGGYAGGSALVTTGASYGDGTVRFEIEGLEEWQRNNGGVRQAVTLMCATNGSLGGIDRAMVTDLSASLPRGCRLDFSNDSRSLTLRLGSPLGMLIIVE